MLTGLFRMQLVRLIYLRHVCKLEHGAHIFLLHLITNGWNCPMDDTHPPIWLT